MTPTTRAGEAAADEKPTRRAKATRIVAGGAAGGASLVLALLLTSSPELFGRARAEDPTSEAFIFVWALIALPVAGLLHTPQALVRRARISAGWALIAGYWLYIALMAALAWQVQGFFPAHDAPGKNGGLFGAAIQRAQDDRRREVLRPHVDGRAGVLPVRLPTGVVPADVGDGGGRSPGAGRAVRGGGAR
ncbi:hypothetical protein ACFWJ5_15635 [Streptomyces qaidamensis]|uniref:hypothetical protein n=1 Tax=Streptomyces qaidamensis TaxID=1783515 RepID=UPI00365C4AC1